MEQLTSALVRELKTTAHTLSPITNIGKSGFSDTVFAEIDKHLDKRELIKIKVLKAVLETMSKEEVVKSLETRLQCAVIAYTGNILILYRAHGTKD